jgi:hypothetical protein
VEEFFLAISLRQIYSDISHFSRKKGAGYSFYIEYVLKSAGLINQTPTMNQAPTPILTMGTGYSISP